MRVGHMEPVNLDTNLTISQTIYVTKAQFLFARRAIDSKEWHEGVK